MQMEKNTKNCARPVSEYEGMRSRFSIKLVWINRKIKKYKLLKTFRINFNLESATVSEIKFSARI
jgi:hypothetical protein